jgi:hypothetical protein
MSRAVTIDSGFASAEETAQTLGVPLDRTRQLVKLFNEDNKKAGKKRRISSAARSRLASAAKKHSSSSTKRHC